MQGFVASLRSHGEFERYANFDFPSDWGISSATLFSESSEDKLTADNRSTARVSLIEQLRDIVQRLGHRLRAPSFGDDATQWATTDSALNEERVSEELFGKLRSLAMAIAKIESHCVEDETALEWPFDLVSSECLELLSLELLESVAELMKLLDHELNFETTLVVEKAFGYNAQTRRFTDSRDGVRDVTPWMISQFPRIAKRIEEISDDGSFLRVWSEVFDRSNGKLLSVSALGEPFASIAICKPQLNVVSTESVGKEYVHSGHSIVGQETTLQDSIATAAPTSDTNDAPGRSATTPELARKDNGRPALEEASESPTRKTAQPLGSSEQRLQRQITAFRRQQAGQWALRGEERRPNGHIRVALLQADFDLTYKHPLVEACPTNWPFCAKVRDAISQHLLGNDKSRMKYEALLGAGGKPGVAYLWTGVEGKSPRLPSWSEHRRQAILRRVVDSCDAFGVDLLVLPEYSVRRETIEWLKTYLPNKKVSVLAGTFMEVQKNPSDNHLSAPLTLLWPLPQAVKNQYIASLKNSGLGTEKDYDALNRGHVLEFSRNKKYRSIALEEFFRPSNSPLAALFRPDALAKALENKIGFEPSSEVMSLLLARTRLPLKYFLELICSEIFLVSSPANYRHMLEDLDEMLGKFGENADDDAVFADVRTLSDQLCITGDGIGVRRSILAVPAATSRSADYWIAGQASFLAAGTTTVFCNSVDNKTIVGGSCFIGCGSWKAEDSTFGYIGRITPYHGWSKGIFYNNSTGTLSRTDQAVVIADIDPHNMLEGRPRGQTMPSPLKLVAYLPLVESVDWETTEANLLRTLSIPIGEIKVTKGINKKRAQDEEVFWNAFVKAKDSPDADSLAAFWKRFPDVDSLESRAKAFHDNGEMQPTGPNSDGSILSTPAFYDWIDVSLTLSGQQELPIVEVPPWKKPTL